jgi:hypothetical protein
MLVTLVRPSKLLVGPLKRHYLCQAYKSFFRLACPQLASADIDMLARFYAYREFSYTKGTSFQFKEFCDKVQQYGEVLDVMKTPSLQDALYTIGVPLMLLDEFLGKLDPVSHTQF